MNFTTSISSTLEEVSMRVPPFAAPSVLLFCHTCQELGLSPFSLSCTFLESSKSKNIGNLKGSSSFLHLTLSFNSTKLMPCSPKDLNSVHKPWVKCLSKCPRDLPKPQLSQQEMLKMKRLKSRRAVKAALKLGHLHLTRQLHASWDQLCATTDFKAKITLLVPLLAQLDLAAMLSLEKLKLPKKLLQNTQRFSLKLLNQCSLLMHQKPL
jgi:hypothetical protein